MKLSNTIRKLETGEPLRIIALGDSLTQGWMVRKGFLAFLSEMLKKKYPSSRVEIINRGIPGDTADGGLYRLRGDVLDHDPDLVFIQFGLNDAFSGVHPGRFEAAIQAIVESVRSDTDAEILIITSVPVVYERMDEIADEFYGRLEAVAGRENLPIARVHRFWMQKVDEGLEFRSLVQSDQVHPTVEGYRLMAEAIMEHF
jgi:lysophospholipase L1-like esterase